MSEIKEKLPPKFLDQTVIRRKKSNAIEDEDSSKKIMILCWLKALIIDEAVDYLPFSDFF
jgi:hypothetical protein